MQGTRFLGTRPTAGHHGTIQGAEWADADAETLASVAAVSSTRVRMDDLEHRATSLVYAPCFPKRGGERNGPSHSLTYRGGSGDSSPLGGRLPIDLPGSLHEIIQAALSDHGLAHPRTDVLMRGGSSADAETANAQRPPRHI